MESIKNTRNPDGFIFTSENFPEQLLYICLFKIQNLYPKPKSKQMRSIKSHSSATIPSNIVNHMNENFIIERIVQHKVLDLL